jgi:hypothetical protein
MNRTVFSTVDDITESRLDSLHTWMKQLTLSRPIKNIARDFSDGQLLAETIKLYIPDLVQLHSYPEATSFRQKMRNLELLNKKVLKKLECILPTAVLEEIATSRPQAVERVLNILQYKISVYKNAKNPTISDNSATDISLNNSLNTSLQNTSNNGLNYSGELHDVVEATEINLKKPITTNLTEIDLEILKDKELLIREQQNTIELLNLKIQKLEQLIQMKDRLLSQTIK